MSESYLEVTYVRGRALAAYFYLPRRKRDKSVRARRAAPGLVIDVATDGRAIGIEITASSRLTVTAFNRVLRDLGFAPVPRALIWRRYGPGNALPPTSLRDQRANFGHQIHGHLDPCIPGVLTRRLQLLHVFTDFRDLLRQRLVEGIETN